METKTFDGRNVTIVMNADRIPVGRIPGQLYNTRRHLPVSIDIRVERLERRALYETIHHEQAERPLNFHILATVWRPDGHDALDVRPATEVLATTARYGQPAGGLTRDGLRELAEFVGRWNLNDMQAGCAHQETKMRGHYLTADACPHTGYRYGQAWLVEPLPSGFMATLSGFLATAPRDRVYVLS
jgi:hypothetical protein